MSLVDVQMKEEAVKHLIDEVNEPRDIVEEEISGSSERKLKE